jgi:hypothetical protein
MVLSVPTTIRPNYAAAPNTGSCLNAGTYPSPLFFVLPFLQSLNPSLELNNLTGSSPPTEFVTPPDFHCYLRPYGFLGIDFGFICTPDSSSTVYTAFFNWYAYCNLLLFI